MLASLGSAAAAQDGHSLSDPFDMWLSGGLVLNNGHTLNPLKCWMKQKCMGNTHVGLVYMAPDVLSCPGEQSTLLNQTFFLSNIGLDFLATSVNVERALNFGRDYETSKRHRPVPKLVSRGMMVAFYSKNHKKLKGILSQWKHGLQEDHKMKRKGKDRIHTQSDENNSKRIACGSSRDVNDVTTLIDQDQRSSNSSINSSSIITSNHQFSLFDRIFPPIKNVTNNRNE
ncbi:hypothetical protein PSTG_15232 [Puccinia striiformis f. sp. tritici PST-78]|uniref:Uncharacterized protein n=1 Tax=Puccinia striiformis f. sp. tritici PST-78 TaxID=1165861 RepID=A0A0L0UWD8_9BASI|nr:hypothetical protein PSTG_15232 [Puccinia striiformis f. sp. tritici PST-78]